MRPSNKGGRNANERSAISRRPAPVPARFGARHGRPRRRGVRARYDHRWHREEGWRVPRRLAVGCAAEGSLQLPLRRHHHVRQLPDGLLHPLPRRVPLGRGQVGELAHGVRRPERRELRGQAQAGPQVGRRYGVHLRRRHDDVLGRPLAGLRDLDLRRQARGAGQVHRAVPHQPGVVPRTAPRVAQRHPSELTVRHLREAARGPLRRGQNDDVRRSEGRGKTGRGLPPGQPAVDRPVQDRQSERHRRAAHDGEEPGWALRRQGELRQDRRLPGRDRRGHAPRARR